jgi:hypothetical protein
MCTSSFARPSARSLSFGHDVALPAFVAAGAACAHADEDGRAHHCYGPWFHVAQLEDVQPSLGLDLVPCDDVGVASFEVHGCSCYPSCYHGGCDACGDEGWDGDERGAFFLLDQKGVVDLRGKKNWPVSVFGSPMGAAAACT